MKTTLIIGAAVVCCGLLSACGGGADSGVEVRQPATDTAQQAEDPKAALSISGTTTGGQ